MMYTYSQKNLILHYKGTLGTMQCDQKSDQITSHITRALGIQRIIS